jgi:hypothetical protein
LPEGAKAARLPRCSMPAAGVTGGADAASGAEAGIEGVAEGVAEGVTEEVEAQHGESDGGAWEG